jgi:hypothetical protein
MGIHVSSPVIESTSATLEVELLCMERGHAFAWSFRYRLERTAAGWIVRSVEELSITDGDSSNRSTSSSENAMLSEEKLALSGPPTRRSIPPRDRAIHEAGKRKSIQHATLRTHA